MKKSTRTICPPWLLYSLLILFYQLLLVSGCKGPDKPSILNNNAKVDLTGQFDRDPTIITDKIGNWMVCWSGNSGAFNAAGQDCPGGPNKSHIYTQFSKNGNFWYGPYCLRKATYNITPHIATDRKGKWTIVWSSEFSELTGKDNEILYNQCTSQDLNQAGRPWKNLPSLLNGNANEDNANDINPQIESNGNRIWMVVWQSNTIFTPPLKKDYNILCSISNDDGTTWNTPIKLNTNSISGSGSDMWPAIAYGNGVWIVVWHSRDDLNGKIDNDADILFTQSKDNGTTWSIPQPLNSDAATDLNDDEFPSVATDGNGQWRVVWHTNKNLTDGTTQTDKDIIFSKSVNNGDNWELPQYVNTDALNDNRDDRFPQVAAGGERWFVVWQGKGNDPSSKLGMDYDIYMTSDYGQHWLSPSVVHSTAKYNLYSDTSPSIAVDDKTNWIITWSSDQDLDNSGTDEDIFYVRSFKP